MSQIPIACSLGPDPMKTRGDEWRALLEPTLVERRAIPGGVRMILRNSPAAAEELRRLIALENSCCAWIDWTVEEGDLLEVDAVADQEQGVAVLEEWFLATS